MTDQNISFWQKVKKWGIKQVPSRKSLQENKFLKPFAHRFLPRELWRFTRRSVPRGVALGFLTAILVIVPGFQIIVAVLLALPFRANIPVAVITTFINTPMTTPPLLYLAYIVGTEMLRIDRMTSGQPISTHMASEDGGWLRWLFSDVAPPTALGLFTIAVVGAAISYLLASLFWRVWIARKRKKNREAFAGKEAE